MMAAAYNNTSVKLKLILVTENKMQTAKWYKASI